MQSLCFDGLTTMVAYVNLIMCKTERLIKMPATTACTKAITSAPAFIFIKGILWEILHYLLFVFSCNIRNILEQIFGIFNHTDTYQSIRLPRSRVTGSVFCSATSGSSSSYSDICICIAKVTFAPGKILPTIC